MSAIPLIDIDGVVKAYGGDHALRIPHLAVEARDRLVLSGFDAHAAEMFIHLVCGAALPDEGVIRVEGIATSEVTTDQEWLTSLDRFGLVSHRSVLVDSLPTLANLVMPLTLSLDPMPAPARAEAEAVARHVELGADRLHVPVSALSAAERLRLHLGRALVLRPRLILLEHPTSTLETDTARAAFGRLVADVGAARQVGFVALSDDELFTEATKARRLRRRGDTGELREGRGWWPWRGN